MSLPRWWGGGGVGEERFRWYSDGGMFVEMDRGMDMEKDDQCAYCPFSKLPAHLNKLISLSFSPFSIQ